VRARSPAVVGLGYTFGLEGFRLLVDGVPAMTERDHRIGGEGQGWS
jgi:hypothetical protein